jgi:hypothetical protein
MVCSFDVETFEFPVPNELVLIFLSSEYAISKQRAVKVDPVWASVKTDPTFTADKNNCGERISYSNMY